MGGVHYLGSILIAKHPSYGADLIVVRDINVDRSTRPYPTTGGTVHHVENYRAPAADLQATRWLGRVPQEETT